MSGLLIHSDNLPMDPQRVDVKDKRMRKGIKESWADKVHEWARLLSTGSDRA